MSLKNDSMNITTKQEFIDFLNEEMKNIESWENKDLSSFLEALLRYTNDIQGYYDNSGQDINSETPSWKLFSDLIKGASMYE